MNVNFEKFILDEELKNLLYNSPSVIIPKNKEVLYELIFGSLHGDEVEVKYKVGDELIKEAHVVRCKNGAAVNYPEDYMRRRDPDSMRIGDDLPTDKPRFKDVYGYDFKELRKETLDWLTNGELIVVPFMSGGYEYGYESLLVCPRNAAFFAFALAELQSFLEIDKIDNFKPRAIVYVAPPFRHTHFEGKQVVVHNRTSELHEIFSYNLYPGPSAKKGIYSVLLDIGEAEGWLTAHASAARIITPYENEIVMMHEGASGGGKSELLQDVMRQPDGRVLLGEDIITGDMRFINMSDTCLIEPVTDDMAICHPALQTNNGRLSLYDGENGWFIRVDGIKEYGSEPTYEKIAIHSPKPLMFFNIEAVPHSTCLPWEHSVNQNGEPCSNPRVIIPRNLVKNIVKEKVSVDVRSFGVRMPPSSAKNPSYGIMGLMQILPPALAWVWRLIAPRGYNNPSVVSDIKGLSGEGVGSYWPFATGLRVKQANMLLEQIIDNYNTRCVLIPNQHIGTYKVGFTAEWIAREYLARRGGVRMKPDRLTPARCSLMGYSLKEMKVDGQYIPTGFLRPETQESLGEKGYDKGAEILYNFFIEELKIYDKEKELNPIGRKIIDCVKSKAPVEAYVEIVPFELY